MNVVNHFVSLPAKSQVEIFTPRNVVVDGAFVKETEDNRWKPSVGVSQDYDLQTLMNAGVAIPQASHQSYSGLDDNAIVERSANSLESALNAESKRKAKSVPAPAAPAAPAPAAPAPAAPTE